MGLIREGYYKTSLPRYHLLEIHEQEWCPRFLARFATDSIKFLWTAMMLHKICAELLVDPVRKSNCTRIVDLCSGSGGPLPQVVQQLRSTGLPLLRGVFSDLFPHIKSWEKICKENIGISYEPNPVNALNVPASLKGGFRTMFVSFHHFTPDQAAQILQDAVDQHSGIAIFELTQRTCFAILFFLALGWCGAFVVPFLIWPFSIGRIFFSCFFPLVPLILSLDGAVSCIRTYTPMELEAMVVSTKNYKSYTWKIGTKSVFYWPIPITYLIGYPSENAANSGKVE